MDQWQSWMPKFLRQSPSMAMDQMVPHVDMAAQAPQAA
jgi:hypothetical protein